MNATCGQLQPSWSSVLYNLLNVSLNNTGDTPCFAIGASQDTALSSLVSSSIIARSPAPGRPLSSGSLGQSDTQTWMYTVCTEFVQPQGGAGIFV